MQKRFIASALALAILAIARSADVRAAELKGRVVSVNGEEARVELEGDYLPNEGDPVSFSCEIPGVGPASAGTGRVTGFEGETVIVRIDAGDSGPQEGFLVSITSARPRMRNPGPGSNPPARSGDDRARIQANEERANAALKQLVSTEGVWRQTDSDRNGAQDYWTLDLAGFYGKTDAAGDTYKYIDVNLARADAKGAGRYKIRGEPADKAGYRFSVMETDENGRPYALDEDGDGKSETNPSKYAFCAYPRAYGETGKHTFIVNEEGVVYAKDLGPGAKEGCATWPDYDPTTKGWLDSDTIENSATPPEGSAAELESGGTMSEVKKLYDEGNADQALARIGEVAEGIHLAALKKKITRVANAYRDALAAEERKDDVTAKRWCYEIVGAEEDRDNFYRMVADQKAGLDPTTKAADLARQADVQAAYRQAVSKYEDGAFEEAAKLFHKSAEMKFEPAASFYYEACSWALAGNAGKALAALDQAIEAGYDDADHMEEDADLESLHENKAFQKLLAKLRQ